jgi:hypothetical protein
VTDRSIEARLDRIEAVVELIIARTGALTREDLKSLPDVRGTADELLAAGVIDGQEHEVRLMWGRLEQSR